MRFSKRLMLIVIVLISCVGCDQVTKSIAVSTLPDMTIFSYFGDTLRFQLTYNRGAFLGMGSSFPAAFQYIIFTVGISLLLLGSFGYALFSKPGRFPVILGVSLFFAGGFGNLIDRVLRNGSVVDFINIGVGPLRTGIFNVADIAIMGGFLILFLGAIQKQRVNR